MLDATSTAANAPLLPRMADLRVFETTVSPAATDRRPHRFSASSGSQVGTPWSRLRNTCHHGEVTFIRRAAVNDEARPAAPTSSVSSGWRRSLVAEVWIVFAISLGA